MSKILRRPMFRGGAVDSRGTGITSGLMDTPKYATGGRVGYNQGDLVLGGDLYSKDDYTKFMTNYANNLNKNSALYKSIFTTNDDGEVVIDDDSKYSYENMFGQATGKSENPQSVFTNVDQLIDSTSPFLPPPGGTQDLGKALKSNILADLKASKQFDTSSEPRGPQELGITTREDPPPPPDNPNGNGEQKTEIDPKTLMRENAELFKELLGEGNEKKLKDARIQDASDYLLKFFEGSQREGATVGSSGAEVAAFATSKPSKTERVQEGIEKGDQTAIALAINDYIAGKRSKEQIDLMEKKLGANFASQIALIDYKNKKNNFFDNLKENRKGGMGSAEAIITTVQETFDKVPTVLTTDQVKKGVNVISKDNVGEYFVYPDGKVTKVIEDLDGNIIEDIVYSRGG
jgi:hypothetical protein